MPASNLRRLIGKPQTKIGTFLFEFVTPGIGHILKAAGADYAVLDMEHTGFSFDTVRATRSSICASQRQHRPAVRLSPRRHTDGRWGPPRSK
jgi:2-keto-3-deoxy-L-rhamnonate aldolase RhmA